MKNYLFSSEKSYILLSALLLAAACILRLYNLSGTSIWLDEAIAAINSQGTFAQTVSNTQHYNSSPILHPLLLYLIQKVDTSATAVRLPSAIGSVLTILVILSLPRIGVDKRIAFLAAVLLTFSASQIEYAQEVREYSISALYAAIILYTLLFHLQYEHRKIAFYSTMFFAPLVQYGLVLFAVSALLILALERLHRYNWKVAIADSLVPGILLGMGGLLSLWLTLRHQWDTTSSAWYLEERYYTGSIGDVPAILRFLARNTLDFLYFILPGSGVVALAIPAFGLVAYRCYNGLKCNAPLLLLALVAISIVSLASVAHIYPYGSVHQDLFLAPVVALLFSTAYVAISESLSTVENKIWIVMVFLFRARMRHVKYHDQQALSGKRRHKACYDRTDPPVFPDRSGLYILWCETGSQIL